MNNKCYLYWIHRPCDVNLLEEGYIGISVNPKLRWKHHLNKRNNNQKNHRLYNAMRKHDDYEMKILLIGSPEYCLEIERSLRPNKNIGLNHAVGGRHESVTTKDSFTDSVKSKIRVGLKKAYLENESYRHSVKIRNKGKVTSIETRNKQRLAKLNKGLAWENSRAILDIWAKADIYFECFNEMLNACLNSRHKVSVRIFCELSGLTPGNSKSLLKMFRSGWNPNLDNNWKLKFNKEI